MIVRLLMSACKSLFLSIRAYILNHRWLNRVLYVCSLFWWLILNAPIFIVLARHFDLRETVFIFVPVILLIAHMILGSFFTWVINFGTYLGYFVWFAYTLISTTVLVGPLTHSYFMAWVSCLYALLLVALPLVPFVFTVPPRRVILNVAATAPNSQKGDAHHGI